MKSTIKETVSEVYKNSNNNNVSFNKNIRNFDKNLNGIPNIKNNVNSNKNKNNNHSKMELELKPPPIPTSGPSIWLFVILFILIAIISCIVYFRDSILEWIQGLLDANTSTSNNEDMEQKLKEMEEKLQENAEKHKKELDELKDTKKKETPPSKEEEKKDSTIGVKQQYSNSQMVQEDGYCFIGSDDNMRHCVDAYQGEVCQSGDIYRRMDDCLIPKYSQDHCGP